MVLMIIRKTTRAFFMSIFFKKFIFYAGHYVQLIIVSTLTNLVRSNLLSLSMKILDLYSNIYIFKSPKVKQNRNYYTRSKVKRLREIISNKIFLQVILKQQGNKRNWTNTKRDKADIKKFNLRISISYSSDFSVILLLQCRTKETAQVVSPSQSLINNPKFKK